MDNPFLINFPKLGAPEIGYISVTEQRQLVPFEIKRIFWTYYTPESIVRGHHATEQVLIAAAGRTMVTTELVNGEIQVFWPEDLYVAQRGRHRRLGDFCHCIDIFRVDIQRPGGSLGWAALLSHVQCFGTECHIVFASFIRFWRVFHDERNIPPCSICVN